MVLPAVSVIIPTYNRKDSLLRTLENLSRQTYPADRFEVIVVDDGSTDDTTTAIANESYPFRLHYIRKANQGDAVARNVGGLDSRAEALVFIDDDIAVEPEFIANIVHTLALYDRTVVVGNLLAALERETVFQKVYAPPSRNRGNLEVVHFTQCLSGFFAVKRNDYLAIGMMQSLTGQGPDAWCDVDFAYKAYLLGFEFRRDNRAIGYHYDVTVTNLTASCRRWERVSHSAVLLFRKNPELQSHIPMFRDKTPISLRHDPPRLILRKAGRALTAWQPVLWGMEQLAHLLERVGPQPALLRPLYRWTISSYIYRGYRQGLRDFGPVEQR